MAAGAAGATDLRLLLRHILRNAVTPIFVVVAVDLGGEVVRGGDVVGTGGTAVA